MDKEQKEIRKVITARGNTRKSYWDLLELVVEAANQGYVIPPQDRRHTADIPVLYGRQLRVVMYPKDYDIPKPGNSYLDKVKKSEDYLAEARAADAAASGKKDEEVIPEVVVEPVVEDSPLKEAVMAMTKKDELMAFAEEHSIEVPEDKKSPKAIQKYIIEQL